jgi:hypothetical protein
VQHLATDLDVDGVYVVEETGVEDASELEDKPCEEEDGDGARAPKANRCNGGFNVGYRTYGFG